MDISISLLLLSLFSGLLIGLIAGLLPGIHVNNTSAVLLGVSPTLIACGIEPLYIASAIVVSTIAQSFLDIIPSVFVGAPDEATVLAVMPGHRMLLDGRGLEAVRLSAMGSGLAIVISLLLIIPLALFFKTALPYMMAYMAVILIAISGFVILSNFAGSRYVTIAGRFRKICQALLLFAIAGILGITAFKAEPGLSPLVTLGAPSVLLPLLSGLFGVPSLLLSLGKQSSIPRQRQSRITLKPGDILGSSAAGTVSGALVSWFPAVSSGVATSLVGIFSKKDRDSDQRYLISVSGVNTSNAVFSLVALYVILRPRSGAVAAAQDVLGGSIGFEAFVLFLLAICLAGLLSYLLTLAAGSYAASAFSAVNYRLLSLSVLAFLTVLCLLLTGVAGIAVFLTSAAVGLAAHLLNVRKTCLMGVLLVPCILYFL